MSGCDTSKGAPRMAGRVAWVSIHREGIRCGFTPFSINPAASADAAPGRRSFRVTSELVSPRGNIPMCEVAHYGVRYQCAPHRGARAAESRQ